MRDASIHFSPKTNDNISKEYTLNINEEVVIKRIDRLENKKSFCLNFTIELWNNFDRIGKLTFSIIKEIVTITKPTNIKLIW